MGKTRDKDREDRFCSSLTVSSSTLESDKIGLDVDLLSFKELVRNSGSGEAEKTGRFLLTRDLALLLIVLLRYTDPGDVHLDIRGSSVTLNRVDTE